jgi:excisionase family DNA binding protein
MTAPKMLTVDEVAEQLRCSIRYVHDELRRKNLRGTKAACWLVSEDDLEVYLAAKANVRPVRRSA